MHDEFLQILNSDRVSAQTRAVLNARADASSAKYLFFSAEEQALMERLERVMLPQPETGAVLPPSRYIDARLAAGEGAGWRYDTLPADPEAYQLALQAVSREIEAAQIGSAVPADADLLDLLERMQRKEFDAPDFAISRWLEGLKVELTKFWLAHPQTMALMRYDGFADDWLTSLDVPPGSAR